MVKSNENFAIILTQFVLSFSLPKFLLIFGAKLLFMLLIAFPVLSSKIKLQICTFFGHLQTITTFTPLVLLVSFFFNCMSITNLSLSLNFVVFLAMAKLKKGYRCYDLSSSLYLLQCCYLGTSLLCRAISLPCLPIYLLCLRSFFQMSHIFLTPDPLIDFFVQPQDIFDTSPRSPSNEQVKDEPHNLELGSPAPAPSENLAQDIPSHYSTRVRSIPAHLLDYHCYTALATLHEPHTYRKAFTNPSWQIIMKEELDTLSKNYTWDLVTLLPRKSVVGCKWIYKIKTRPDGSIERYKTHLVVKDFTREYGIDYEETFAPVAQISSICALSTVATASKLDIF